MRQRVDKDKRGGEIMWRYRSWTILVKTARKNNDNMVNRWRKIIIYILVISSNYVYKTMFMHRIYGYMHQSLILQNYMWFFSKCKYSKKSWKTFYTMEITLWLLERFTSPFRTLSCSFWNKKYRAYNEKWKYKCTIMH